MINKTKESLIFGVGLGAVLTVEALMFFGAFYSMWRLVVEGPTAGYGAVLFLTLLFVLGSAYALITYEPSVPKDLEEEKNHA